MPERTTAGIALLMFGAALGVVSRAEDNRVGYEEPVIVPFGFQSFGFALPDLNGDGVGDLLMSGTTLAGITWQHDLRVAYADGAGGFDAAQSVGLDQYGFDGVFVIPSAGDEPDRVFVNALQPAVITFDAEGGPSVAALDRPDSYGPSWVLVQSFDGDLLPDVVTSSNSGFGERTLVLWRQQSDGGFTLLEPLVYAEGFTTDVLHAGDFDGDGHTDLFAAPTSRSGSQDLGVLLFGNGDGTFEIGGVPPTLGGSTPTFAAGDLNGDGRADLTDGRNVYLGQADRTFSERTNVTTAFRDTASRLVDIDRDGKLDLFTTYEEVFYGKGDGTFEAVVSAPTRKNPFNPARTFHIADVTGDGRVDFVAVDSTQLRNVRVEIYEQNEFPPPVVLSLDQPELSTHGVQFLRLTGSGFRRGARVVSLGDVVVETVTWESETSLLLRLDVPPGIGVDAQSLQVVNPDGRSTTFDLGVRGLFVLKPRGRVVDRDEPGRDKVDLRADLEFTRLSARGAFGDVRQDLELAFGDPDEPFVVALPSDPDRWTLRGPTVPGRFIYRSAPGESPQLKVVVDTARGVLKVRATDFDLPGSPQGPVLLRIRVAGEPGEVVAPFDLRTKRRGERRILRRR